MFSIRLKTLRENKKLSQKDLSTVFGISQGTVGNWESGIREPNFSTLVKLANYFGVSTDYLLGHSSDVPNFSLFSQQEKLLIENYKQLNSEGQEKLLSYSDDLMISGRYFSVKEPLHLVAEEKISVPPIVEDEVKHT